MRVAATWIGVLLLAPLAGALIAPAPDVPLELAMFPPDAKDADVIALLAREWGVTPTRLPLPRADLRTLPLEALVIRLGERAGTPVSPEDALAFASLDPRVAAPVATLLLAVDEAWTLRERAFADWSDEDLQAALAALESGGSPPKILSNQQKEDLVNAAIMLTDTIESVVIPQLEAAAQAGVWPATPVADPVGVLRIGGTGNDVETIERIVQIDARGDDEYRNNAGAAYVRTQLSNVPYNKLVAVSLDLSGNDLYKRLRNEASMGAGSIAIGVFYDLDGNDKYYPVNRATGWSSQGIGVFRDMAGNDLHEGDWDGLGSTNAGLAYFRDDAGDDTYRAVVAAGGFGGNGGLGLFWDRAGTESYESILGSTMLWGYAITEGKGWFVDETTSFDVWLDLDVGRPHPRACNDCIWSGGLTPGGRGNDNRGGLGYLVGWQDP